jgi:hypothetical protein
MRVEFNSLIKPCGTLTVPATGTKAIGLQADAQVVMVFARHLDNFIVTRKSFPLIWTTPFGQFYRDTKPSSINRAFARLR